MFKRIVSLLILVAMVFTYAMGSISSHGEISKPVVSANQMSKLLVGKVSSDDSKSKKTKKKETVYIELKDDGSTGDIIVSDALEVHGNGPITDKTSLKDITNLKGDEDYETTQDGNIVWENKGEDITYQGTSDRNPPIGVSISYSLDGKDISAKDLEGKSGELQIQYKFKNNAKTKGHDNIPFIVLGGFALDSNRFTNVQIDHGKEVEYDESKIVLGYAAPGLEEYLDQSVKGADEFLGKIDLPDSFTISAYVKDFSMDMGIIVATSNIDNFNIKDSIDLSNIKEKMNELQNGADQLVDGAAKLNDGTSKLSPAALKIKNGINSLDGGLGKLYSGMNKFYKNEKKFNKGLKKGLKSAKAGAKKLADGSSELSKGAKQVDDGAKAVDSGASSVNSGSKQVSGGLAQIKNGFDKDNGLIDGSKAIKNGTKSANEGVKKIVKTLNDTPSSIQEQINGVLQQVSQASGGQITTEAQLNNVIEGINSAVAGGIPLETVLEAKGLSIKTYYSLLQAYYSIKTLSGVKSTFEQQISQSSSEINELLKGMNSLESGSESLYDGVNQAYEGISAAASGASQLSDGSGKLKNGTSQLSKGTGSLKNGAASLSTGMGQLYGGTVTMQSKLGEAAPKLLTGAGKIRAAMNQACGGTTKLANGMVPFCNGIDELKNGTKQLSDGASKLNKEGIKKITSIFGDKADGLIDSIQDLIDAGNSYNSFSGISKGMDGQVKFIYKTPEIGIEE